MQCNKCHVCKCTKVNTQSKLYLPLVLQSVVGSVVVTDSHLSGGVFSNHDDHFRPRLS